MATVYDYMTGDEIGSVSQTTYDSYLDEIEADLVGAVDGTDYGYPRTIYMSS